MLQTRCRCSQSPPNSNPYCLQSPSMGFTKLPQPSIAPLNPTLIEIASIDSKNLTALTSMNTIILAVVATTLIAGALAAPPPPFYPLFSQCDERWMNDTLGFGPETLCQAGCAMSSTTMLLAHFNVTLLGQTLNPGNFNRWLRLNGGYERGTHTLTQLVTPQTTITPLTQS
jgi:hypothetical protein